MFKRGKCNVCNGVKGNKTGNKLRHNSIFSGRNCKQTHLPFVGNKLEHCPLSGDLNPPA